jgi:hypothetical protein
MRGWIGEFLMPACSVKREVVGTTSHYRIDGRFEGACAWDLARRLDHEDLPEVILDFARVNDFVDYGVAVLAGALLSLKAKRVRLTGLRQHQLRLFRYFGVDADEMLRGGEARSAQADLPGLPALTEAV